MQRFCVKHFGTVSCSYQAVGVIRVGFCFCFLFLCFSLYHSLSLWVIRMHPGCLSARSLITQRGTGLNTKYTVCPHLSTLHKVLLWQKTTHAQKLLTGKAVGLLVPVRGAAVIQQEEGIRPGIYVKTKSEHKRESNFTFLIKNFSKCRANDHFKLIFTSFTLWFLTTFFLFFSFFLKIL